jgi:hypothetical protein
MHQLAKQRMPEVKKIVVGFSVLNLYEGGAHGMGI